MPQPYSTNDESYATSIARLVQGKLNIDKEKKQCRQQN